MLTYLLTSARRHVCSHCGCTARRTAGIRGGDGQAENVCKWNAAINAGLSNTLATCNPVCLRSGGVKPRTLLSLGTLWCSGAAVQTTVRIPRYLALHQRTPPAPPFLTCLFFTGVGRQQTADEGGIVMASLLASKDITGNYVHRITVMCIILYCLLIMCF